MASEDVERRLTAILSADVSGYSRLMGEDDEATLKTLTEYREVQFYLIGHHKGRVINAPGDALLAEFTSVNNAVLCAVEVQREIAKRNEDLPENRKMEYRFGIHLGDVLVKKGALYGDGVNIAARLESLADAGSICVSQVVYDQVKNKIDGNFQYLGEYAVKNISDPVKVYWLGVFPDDIPPKRNVGTRSSVLKGAAIAAIAIFLLEGAGYLVWDSFWRPKSVSGRLASTPADDARLAIKPLAKNLSPKTSFRECADCPEMVIIPNGSFVIGSAESEKGHRSEEGPQTEIKISRSFAIGKFEITFNNWDACVRNGGCRHNPQDRGWGRGNRPVFYVSWQDTQAYVKWLSKVTGHTYRLPSEFEWEYATRAGTKTPYWWGKEIGKGRATCEGCNDYEENKTTPVGSFRANSFGLFDVHGNVWEWTSDCWNGTFAGAPTGGAAWTTGNCDKRVLRGGSWGIKPKHLRASRRRSDKITLRSGKRGFRIAMTLP
jgi:formylglycine-generating enzyme required for sulfatase activity/class 3 adenylate cyclase